METRNREHTYYGWVMDNEGFRDVSLPDLPLGHIVLWDAVDKIMAASVAFNRPEPVTFFKVVSVRWFERKSFFDKLAKRPARMFFEVGLADGFGDVFGFVLTKEVAEKLVVEVSRTKHTASRS